MANSIYLDHNASTPIDPAVLETVIRISRDAYANPSSIEHNQGAAAGKVVEAARSQIAEFVNCRASEILFTSGSTEANNLAILGSYPELKKTGRTHCITSLIEHPSILACFDHLEEKGARVTRLGVDENGQILLDELSDVLCSQTGLVSIMAANNETGVLQPISEAAHLAEAAGALFHTDYSQATAYMPLDLNGTPIHMASFSGHKAYGPKGVGALYRSIRKPRVNLHPVLFGGGQEKGLRAGTLNTPGIAGLGHAFALIGEKWNDDARRIGALRDRLQEELQDKISLQINGSDVPRLPNTLSLSIDNVVPQALMQKLRNDLCFSASSACATEHVATSHVLQAMFGKTPRARNAFRLGLGRQTKEQDIAKIVDLFVCATSELLLLRSI
ncbi:cysteine desulfurase family protein [Thalassospira lucentensis]|uniref:cysteine desulfurase family protein n=1 Tax=Thalassospira lucentensis TaxID=168935 RepID=UPI0003B701A2|nr:cysteine desulfurase family protein [Thalassospira lucentensis]RCK27752.1 aminotransferase class V [Thalassospira lucentensis MCCC 1A00383 = DSM 14000]